MKIQKLRNSKFENRNLKIRNSKLANSKFENSGKTGGGGILRRKTGSVFLPRAVVGVEYGEVI